MSKIKEIEDNLNSASSLLNERGILGGLYCSVILFVTIAISGVNKSIGLDNNTWLFVVTTILGVIMSNVFYEIFIIPFHCIHRHYVIKGYNDREQSKKNVSIWTIIFGKIFTISFYYICRKDITKTENTRLKEIKEQSKEYRDILDAREECLNKAKNLHTLEKIQIQENIRVTSLYIGASSLFLAIVLFFVAMFSNKCDCGCDATKIFFYYIAAGLFIIFLCAFFSAIDRCKKLGKYIAIGKKQLIEENPCKTNN